MKQKTFIFFLAFFMCNFSQVVISQENEICLECHEEEPVVISEFKSSVHGDLHCVDCHQDLEGVEEFPHSETVNQVSCENCHDEIGEIYLKGQHGIARSNGNEEAPGCADCHGTHNILNHLNEKSTVFRTRIPELCGTCHSEDKIEAQSKIIKGAVYVRDYSTSIHGKKVSEAGLLPAAVCSDCHDAHLVLNATNAESKVNRKNLIYTCGQCHLGIKEKFVQSVHFDSTFSMDKPICEDCHSSHQIILTEKYQFMANLINTCGTCHDKIISTYQETIHGKSFALGYASVAKCADCHGAHDILPKDYPASKLSEENIVATCGKCHEHSNRKFTQYITHADYHDGKKYPRLHFAYLFMTGLLVGVFAFFGIHTIFWFFRALKERRKIKQIHAAKSEKKKYISRFTYGQRVMHLFVIISFMLLAVTGMLLKFANEEWAKYVAGLLGSFPVTSVLHRIGALITFGYFFTHLIQIFRKKKLSGKTWRKFLFNKDSLMFTTQDVKDMIAHFKWFIGKGPKPAYERWTYWEKFDYFAVFWGVTIIGSSGLILWFPEFFTQFLPGWVINVAHIVHSDEALLAVGFIFTIHFFNTHLRPEAFPMDKVIFTGVVEENEYKYLRPGHYARLQEENKLDQVMVEEVIDPVKEHLIKIFGFMMLGVGIVMIILIISTLIIH